MKDRRPLVGDFDVVEGTGDSTLPPARSKTKQLPFQHFKSDTAERRYCTDWRVSDSFIFRMTRSPLFCTIDPDQNGLAGVIQVRYGKCGGTSELLTLRRRSIDNDRIDSGSGPGVQLHLPSGRIQGLPHVIHEIMHNQRKPV